MMFEKNPGNFRTYIYFLYWITFFVIPCGTLMLILKLNYPEILDFHQTTVVLINVMGCLVGVFMNSVFITVGDEIMKIRRCFILLQCLSRLKHPLSIYVGSSGALVAFSLSFAIICIKHFGQIQTGMLFVFIGTMAICLVLQFLHRADLFFEISKSIIHKWKKCLTLSSYYKRLFVSFRALEFQIGDVGIIDRDIKMTITISFSVIL